MANYSTAAVSNFFRVKDARAFVKWAKRCGLTLDTHMRDERVYYRISGGEDHGSEGWPNAGYDEKNDESFEIDVFTELAKHLENGSVAVLYETGGMNGSMPYGDATAINNKGEEVSINLTSIYEMAAHLGDELLSLD